MGRPSVRNWKPPASVREPLGPAVRGVLPGFLAAIDGHVQQPVGRRHDLGAAAAGPVGLEDPVPVTQVAHLHAEPASGQQGVGRVPRRVPRHVPAHEIPVGHALGVGALAERGVGGVTGVEVGQLADLAVEERAPLALVRRGLAVVPHVEVHDQLAPALEHVPQRYRAVRPGHRDRPVDLDHGQPPPGRRDRVPLVGVRLLPHPQLIQLSLPARPVGHRRRLRLVGHNASRS